MDKRFAEKWAKALESGQYRQGRYRLRTEDGDYCCLGVLCELQGAKWDARGRPYWNDDDAEIRMNGNTTYLPRLLCEKLGMKKDNTAGRYIIRYADGQEETGCLANDNDNGLNFEQIAAIIREHWEQL